MDIYVVRSGDSLYRIAQNAGVPESRIIADNGLTSSTNLVPGQTLVIQYPGRVHTVSGGETLRSIAERYGHQPASAQQSPARRPARHLPRPDPCHRL